jgi:hypothetical protein
MGTWPQFSYPYPEIRNKLKTWGGNNSPMPYASGKGGVSGLMPWIRVISGYNGKGPQTTGGGLVLQSNYPEDGFNIRYGDGNAGTSGKAGIIGFELDMKTPVRPAPGRPTRPSPIISGLSVSEVDVGRKTTNFAITCYTQEQMEKIAEYFLEPAFYCFVEWGWNTKEARSQWVGDPNSGEITPCQIAKHINYKYIQSKRKAANFEYDCSLGVISNGGVKFGDNETYVIDVEVISQGSVAQYMQSHKAGASATTKTESNYRFDPAKIDESADKDGVAKTLFKQMFNSLPSQKQNPFIKSWIDQPLNIYKDFAFIENGKACEDNTWMDESNYINMDAVVAETILQNLKRSTSLKSESGEELTIPTDQPLLSTERFIRFELACEILNFAFVDLSSGRKSSSSFGCDDNKPSLRINIDTSIIGAFPHMWSLDKNILFIPNPNAPDFNIDAAFNGTAATEKFIDFENLSSKTQNLHPPTNIKSFTGTRQKNGTETPHAFPCQYDLTAEDNKWDTEPSIVPYTMGKEHWGWLKNLYVNFDFFCQTMQTPNYTIQDVLYELLNAMSGACNSHWRFQIVERFHPNQNEGCFELQVVDLNFTGKLNINDDKVPTYQLRGTTSPFIEVDFATTTAAIHQNNILFKRYSKNKKGTALDTHPDLGGSVPVLGSVFSNGIEYVGTIINYTEIIGKSGGDEEEGEAKSETVDDKDAIKSTNYNFFLEKAGVFPRIQDRQNASDVIEDIEDEKIQDIFMVGTFNDSLALRQTFLVDKKQSTNVYGQDGKDESIVNVPFGMAEVNFTVHGMSGFKRGDTLRFEGVPKNFGYPHVYEVTEMEQEVTTTGWYTKIKTKMRPYGTNTAAK